MTIYQFHPHGHLRARHFQYVAVYPDGREQTVLGVPKYDFRWQLAYELETPLTLPAGSKLVITAHYDNSANNKFNPAPDKQVFFRDQNSATDEMFSPFVQYAVGQGPDLPVVETAGCLIKNTLTHATAAVPSDQAPNSRAPVKIQGEQTFPLVGPSAFQSQSHTAAVVRDVLVNGRINVTSLKATGPCPN